MNKLDSITLELDSTSITDLVLDVLMASACSDLCRDSSNYVILSSEHLKWSSHLQDTVREALSHQLHSGWFNGKCRSLTESDNIF